MTAIQQGNFDALLVNLAALDATNASKRATLHEQRLALADYRQARERCERRALATRDELLSVQARLAALAHQAFAVERELRIAVIGDGDQHTRATTALTDSILSPSPSQPMRLHAIAADAEVLEQQHAQLVATTRAHFERNSATLDLVHAVERDIAACDDEQGNSVLELDALSAAIDEQTAAIATLGRQQQHHLQNDADMATAITAAKREVQMKRQQLGTFTESEKEFCAMRSKIDAHSLKRNILIQESRNIEAQIQARQ